MHQKRYLFFFSIVLLLLFSCRKDEEIITDSSASLNFSETAISFDTVFTTVGSATQNIRVYNPFKERIKISSIRLKNGQNSNFRINVDGQAGISHQNIEIAPKDSMYIFIEVTVDPSNDLSPFVVEDQIEFITNGNIQEVKLEAWGQNAHYYTATTFNRSFPDYTCIDGPCIFPPVPVTVTWPNDKPYVIYDFLLVDSLHTLNIDPGVRVYFHGNGGMWVFRGGSLNVNGTLADPVSFQGDRLEPDYADLPGQWDRIWINEGAQNKINNAIIKNAFIGIQAEPLFYRDGPSVYGELDISNTEITNCSGFGLLTGLFNLDADNMNINNCGQQTIAIQADGRYNFNHLTSANYYNAAGRETPSFFIKNSIVTNLGLRVDTPVVRVSNSIIYGNQENELAIEIVNNGSVDIQFSDCLLKTNIGISDTNQFKRIIHNPFDPGFIYAPGRDFRLNANSPAKDAANLIKAQLLPLDIIGNSRLSDVGPDIGAYEYQP